MDNQKVILFDGICNLCNGAVQKVIEKDEKNQFKFASLQSAFGQEFLKENTLNDQNLDSMILLDGDKFYTKSDAALRIGKELKGIYGLSGIFLIVPRFLRNWVYDIIAKNRYKWFGKQESCWLPSPELEAKFLT